jgi:hypothetical protein
MTGPITLTPIGGARRPQIEPLAVPFGEARPHVGPARR